MRKQINIDGMSCGNCVRHVEAALREVAGVGGILVNLEEKMAIVEVNDAVTDANLKEAIEEAGYDVTGIRAL